MRRIPLAIVLALSLAVSACGPQLQTLKTAITLGTASIANPVTKERLNQVEEVVAVMFVGLNAWRDVCVAGKIPDTCFQQIRTVQVYTLQVKPYLQQLRRFVKQNDQVNATVVYNQLSDVIGVIRARGAASGQDLGGGL